MGGAAGYETRPGLKHHVRVGSGSYAHFTSSSQDGAPLRFKLLFKCQRVHTYSSREPWLKTTRVKYRRAPSTCISDDDVKWAYDSEPPESTLT